jgi:hypothetical protein
MASIACRLLPGTSVDGCHAADSRVPANAPPGRVKEAAVEPSKTTFNGD